MKELISRLRNRSSGAESLEAADALERLNAELTASRYWREQEAKELSTERDLALERGAERLEQLAKQDLKIDALRAAKSGCMYGTKPEKPAHTDHPMRHHDRTCPACQKDDVDPVAKVVSSGTFNMPILQWLSADHSFRVPIGTMLFTHPAPKPLTEEEIENIALDYSLPVSVKSFVRAVERHHGIGK